MSLSLYGTKAIHSVLDTKLIDTFGNKTVQNMSSVIVQPAVNVFIYPMLYNMIYERKFGNLVNNRTLNMSRILAGGLALGQGLSDSYMVSWLSGGLESITSFF